MRLACSHLKRTGSRWPDFYATQPEEHSPCCPTNWFLIANIRLMPWLVLYSKYMIFSRQDKQVIMAPVSNLIPIVPWRHIWSRPGQCCFCPDWCGGIMLSVKNFLYRCQLCLSQGIQSKRFICIFKVSAILTALIDKAWNRLYVIISTKLENVYLEEHPATAFALLKIKYVPGRKSPLIRWPGYIPGMRIIFLGIFWHRIDNTFFFNGLSCRQ